MSSPPTRGDDLNYMQAAKPDYRELGISGTRLFAGIISEETVPQLIGINAWKTYQGMRFDATGSALYKSIELPIRAARWFVNSAGDSPAQLQMADFVHDNLWDFGTQSMDDVLRLGLGMLPFGFAWLEILYELIDQGPWKGKVGWSELAYRSPATKWRWNMDYVQGKRDLVSVTQLAPPFYQQVEIPRSKIMLFVNDQEGDNYDGWSIFRPAWKDYYFRDRLYRLRAIALERSGMGVPVASLPSGFSDELRDIAKQIVTSLRLDEQAGVVKPDELMLEILHNQMEGPVFAEAIQYHNRQILLSQLAQFTDLGSKSVGSYALSSDQSELFLMAINAKANYVAEVMNLNPGIPQLLAFNFANVDAASLPKLAHGDIGQRNLDKLGRTMQALGMWGFLTPDDATEDRLRQMLDFPERESAITDRALADLVQEVFPVGNENGRSSKSGSSLPDFNPSSKASKQQGLLPYGPGGGPGTAPAEPGNPAAVGANQQQRIASQDDANMAERRALFHEMVARRAWPRASGRPTEQQRLAMRATEAWVAALDDAQSGAGRVPIRPSVAAARNRRAYRIRASEETQARMVDSGRLKTVTSTRSAAAKRFVPGLAAIMRPKPKE